jgi:hypothetical protein
LGKLKCQLIVFLQICHLRKAGRGLKRPAPRNLLRYIMGSISSAG